MSGDGFLKIGHRIYCNILFLNYLILQHRCIYRANIVLKKQESWNNDKLFFRVDVCCPTLLHIYYNRLSQRVVDNFAFFFCLFFFLNDYSGFFCFCFFSTVKAIWTDHWRSCGILRDKRSPKRQTDREREDAEVDDLKTSLPWKCQCIKVVYCGGREIVHLLR